METIKNGPETCRYMLFRVCFLLFMFYPFLPRAQVTAGFLLPDTICAGQPFQIQNTSVGGTSWKWTFCTANPYDDVAVHTTGNPGSLLNAPHSVALANDNNQYFSFVTNQGDASVIRNRHPGNFYANPVQTDRIPGNGLLTGKVAGIQVKYDDGNWIALIADNRSLIRMNFGASLASNPTIESLGLFPEIEDAYGLAVAEDQGNWYAFVTGFTSNTLTRFDFGPSLTSIPVAVTIPVPSFVYRPTGCCLTRVDSAWHLFVPLQPYSHLARFDFGNMLNQMPTGTNLGNPGDLDHPTGVTVFLDCNNLAGFAVNENNTPGWGIVRLTFEEGITGQVIGNHIGSIGNTSNYRNMSEMYRLRDTLYAYVTAGTQNSLAFFYFPGCSSSVIPFSTDENPVVTYPQEGKYSVLQIVDPGLPTEQRACKSIVVMPEMPLDLGPDRTLCTGDQVLLDAGTGFSSYQWSNGATTQSVTITQSGLYWLAVTGEYGCISMDSVNITFSDKIETSLDTTLCAGERIFAGGDWQTTSGIYTDSLVSAMGCDSIHTTTLTVRPEIGLQLRPDTTLCPGGAIELFSNVPADSFTWQDGSNDSVLVVTEPGIYWLHVAVNGCDDTDTTEIGDCPSRIWVPNAFTPNGDGLNDYFRPKGVSIAKMHLEIYDRWGTLVFTSEDPGTGWDGKSKGKEVPAGTYSYRLTCESEESPTQTETLNGTVTLLR